MFQDGGERLVKIRRALAAKTTTEFPNGRILPGCTKPIMLKNIINSEARFNNLKKALNWITPSVRQLIQTHLKLINHSHAGF